MNAGNRNRLLFGVMVIFIFAACTVSGLGTGSSQNTPATQTPNLTLTEWFRPTQGLPEPEEDATSTSEPQSTDVETTAPPAAPTSTPEAGTDSQPTAASTDPTLIPAETQTPISFAADAADIQIFVPYLDDTPTIDGDTGDWGGELYALDKVVKGSEFYANELDLSGDFKLGWDMEYLYIGVTVRDTQFVQTASGAQLSQGDSLEVLLDTQWEADLGDDDLSADDYQLGFSPGNLKEVSIPEGYLWAPDDRAGSLTMAKVAGRLTDDGYMMEVAIAWEELGVTPTNETTLGFLLSIADNDFISRIEQQSVVSFAPQRFLFDPNTWVPIFLINP